MPYASSRCAPIRAFSLLRQSASVRARLLEQGFEVAVVKDATAATQFPGLDGYAVALTNFQMIADAVMTTDEVKEALDGQKARK